ncbi:hypothetical protein ACFYP4_02490 [Streptomyces sp. NPDC005551]|uniref:hypothetical protein n=1 Tax=Streptomyces sp. NPDC005551 TaxID=3364725 RepID=UPI0036A9CC69
MPHSGPYLIGARKHFHAFSWHGEWWPERDQRANLSLETPPLRVPLWMNKPETLERAVYDGQQQAIAWMESQFTAHKVLGMDQESLAGEVQRAAVALGTSRNYAKSYRTVAGEFAAIALLTCLRKKGHCRT